jgi:uroporphyrin-III C-methyltransferase
MKSELIIIGAGLGAKSITLEGLEALKSADSVLYDRLLHPAVLEMIPENAERVSVGKDPYNKHCTRQEDINTVIAEQLKRHRRVVRLKGGDSTLFARSLEETETAETCGAAVRIIPGVTSASTLAAKISKALTDRRKVSGCVFITGHSKNGDCPYSFKALAELGLTIVVYMGVKNGGYIAEQLILNGMSGNTQVIIGSRLESAEERLCITTLASLGNVLATGEYDHPATIIIGDVSG